MKCTLYHYMPLALIIILGLFNVIRAELKDKREIIGIIPPNENAAVVVDTQVAATTGFTGAVQAANKYFQDIYTAQLKPEEIEFGHVRETPNEWEQRFERINFNKSKHQGKVFKYAHVPANDHYEFGHKRGNEHHFTERHEKGHPRAGEFKTKVRWGDKHGGYGEHYWDYNHAGHGDGNDYAHGDESNVEEIVDYNTPNEHHQHAENYNDNGTDKRRKRQSLAGTRIRDDVEFINDGARDLILGGSTGRHGGNYRREPGLSNRAKREYPTDNFIWYRLLNGRLQYD